MIQRISHIPRLEGPLPPGAIDVGPGTRFASPFHVHKNTLLQAIDTRTHPHGGRCWAITGLPGSRHETRAQAQRVATENYRLWLGSTNAGYITRNAALTELRHAQALSCHCELGYACHVDVLIQLLEANEREW